MMASYPFSEALTTSFYVVNGSGNTYDNNTGETFGLSLTATPIEQIALNFNFHVRAGAEKQLVIAN